MNIMIIGGTSGIGLALALHYLQQGDQVAVCGRDITRVDPAIISHHPALRLYQFDIADQAAVAHAVNDFSIISLDLLIVTAGFYADTKTVQQDASAALNMLQINIGGLSHAFDLAAQKMLTKKSGHLVAISSAAGLLRPYPGVSLYSASKRAVIQLCEIYRKAWAPFSIDVTVIVPGYIDTLKLRELNHGDVSRKPFLMTQQQAVERIVQAIARRDACCVFPWQMDWMIRLFNCLPSRVRSLRKK